MSSAYLAVNVKALHPWSACTTLEFGRGLLGINFGSDTCSFERVLIEILEKGRHLFQAASKETAATGLIELKKVHRGCGNRFGH